ncbi:MAG: abhydrolase domain-containing 18 [Chloracidobacterium sp.]|nr:abhydrolase domain-containing 18 [Chloracidobacterium sp.]
MLRPLMHYFERRLHARDNNARISHPFDWGLEFLGANHDSTRDSQSARQFIRRFNEKALEASDVFYTPPPGHRSDFESSGLEADYQRLSFPSAVITPYVKNNTVHAKFFPADRGDSAVIVSPQWNAKEDSHVALCRGLNRFGVSALRLSLPFHDQRMLDGFTRADFLVSANIGRTIQSVRQAVLDIRRAADWLFFQGYKRVGVIGTSIGSCVSWLAFIHDERLEAGVFNMVSSWFGDVVWRSLTTSHIRRSLETELTAEEVREVWKTISPSAHAGKLSRQRRPALLISTKYDLTFLPDLSQIFFEDCDRHNSPARKVFLPCGHYTLGRAPFKYIDAFHIINFFRRLWR